MRSRPKKVGASHKRIPRAKVFKVEDYNPGYPRFTALLSAYAPFLICRRFNRLRARLLLLKQDKLSILEERLDQIDAQEASPLFLGKSRYDANMDRLSLLTEIEARLADYGEFKTDCLTSRSRY